MICGLLHQKPNVTEMETESNDNNKESGISVKTEKEDEGDLGDDIIKKEVKEEPDCISESHDNTKPFVCILINDGKIKEEIDEGVENECESIGGASCSTDNLAENNFLVTRGGSTTEYGCNFCDFEASNAEALAHHIFLHSRGERVICIYCNKKTTIQNLRRHMIAHVVDKPYQCNLCHYKANRKWYLKKHMKTHTGEKPHTCVQCGYRSSSIYNLKRHIMTHTGEKPYMCSICSYRATEAKTLKYHMLTH